MSPRIIADATAEERKLVYGLKYPTDFVEFNDEEVPNDETDVYVLARVRIPCPRCEREICPLLSTRTRLLENDWRWVGTDHREPYASFLCFCRWCDSPFKLTTYTPQ